MRSGLLQKVRWFATSAKAWSPQSKPKWSSAVKSLIALKNLCRRLSTWRSRPLFGPAPIFVTLISIASGVATPLILLLPKFYLRVTKWKTPESRNRKILRNQRDQLLSVARTLRPPKRLERRGKTITAINVATEHQRMAGYRKDPLQLLGSIRLPPRQVKIQEKTRTEALHRIQPRLPARIATKKATMQTSAQSL